MRSLLRVLSQSSQATLSTIFGAALIQRQYGEGQRPWAMFFMQYLGWSYLYLLHAERWHGMSFTSDTKQALHQRDNLFIRRYCLVSVLFLYSSGMFICPLLPDGKGTSHFVN